MLYKSFALGFAAVCVYAAGFPMEVRVAHRTAPACCVAVGPGGAVYAGTAEGLLVYRDGRWSPLDGVPREPVSALATSDSAVAARFGGAVFVVASGRIRIEADAAVFALDGDRLVRAPESVQAAAIAVGPNGSSAIAARDGLYEQTEGRQWQRLTPRQGSRSWAPVDVRAVSYDSAGRLHFASPQGVGVRDRGEWQLFTPEDGLPYDDFTSIAPAPDGAVWYGTRIGAIRRQGNEWEYREGLRWLPADDVRGVAVSGNTAWFATGGGVGAIEQRMTTLAGKARIFEDEIDRRHRRTEYGYVLGVHVKAPGDSSEWTQHDSDNDGLWTAMYGAGECFACAATSDPEACRRAAAAFEALRFLGTVTQGGQHPAPRGFVARAILPASGPDPNVQDSAERDRREQARDPHWKVMSPRWPMSADGKWYWKSDTSSDELDGHYFFYGVYYDLAAKTDQQKQRVREHVAALTDHLIEHGFELVDYDGKVTRWGVFSPAKLNHDPRFWEERSLNSISILSYLQVAAHITGDPKYRRAAQQLIEEHSYAMNTLISKTNEGFGSGNQSDDEMAFMCLYNLVRYETDPQLRAMYATALRKRWEIEKPELCPLFDYIAAAVLNEKPGDSTDTLRRYPMDRYNWAMKNSHRKDLLPMPDYDERRALRGFRRNGHVLPIDERYVDHWNVDPWRLDYAGDGRYLADGASYLLPYYMGLYHGFVAE